MRHDRPSRLSGVVEGSLFPGSPGSQAFFFLARCNCKCMQGRARTGRAGLCITCKVVAPGRIHERQPRGGILLVSSAFRDMIWQGMGMAGQGIKHPKPCSTHGDQRRYLCRDRPSLPASWRRTRSYVFFFFSLAPQFISYHDLHIHSIFSNVPTERSSISNSTCQVVPNIPRYIGSR